MPLPINSPAAILRYTCYDWCSRSPNGSSLCWVCGSQHNQLSFPLAEGEEMMGSTKRTVLSICALCGLGLGLAEWATRVPGGEPSQLAPEGRRRIVAALHGLRPLEARFTGGGAAGPIKTLPREAMVRLRRIVAGSGARSLSDHALLMALAGDIDGAVSLFTEASLREPRNASILADLAAAYLTRGKNLSHPLDNLNALLASEEALRLKPELVEARCSKAMALDRLYLPAREAWELCLAGEENILWKQEIRVLVQRSTRQEASYGGDPASPLRAALSLEENDLVRHVAERPWSAQRYVEEVSLPLWASARGHGAEAIADSALEVSRRIAAVLTTNSRDPFLWDVTRGIIEAEEASGQKMIALLRAHSAYLRGRKLFESGAYAKAAGELALAGRNFAHARSPFALKANLYLALAERPFSGPQLTAERINAIVEEAQALGYPILAGEGLRLLGLCRLDAGEPALAQEAYLRALRHLARARDLENLARTHNLLAELLGYQGETEEAWSHWERAAKIARNLDTPEILYQVFSVAAMSAFRLGKPEAAAVFQDEAVLSAQRFSNPLARTWSLIWRTRYRHCLGEGSTAEKSLREAQLAAVLIPDSGARMQADIGLSLTKAELDLKSAPEQAVKDLTEALALARNSGALFFQIDAYLLRARAYLEDDQILAAEEDLEQGIQLATVWRRRTTVSTQKIGFQDRQRALFDEMLQLQIDRRKDPVKALEIVERARAQALLDRFSEIRGSEGVRTFADTPLPKRTVILSYASLGKRLGIWISAAGGTHFMAVDLELGQIREAIRVSRRSAVEPKAFTLASELLYERLVQPVREFLPHEGVLVICASGELQQVPWAALKDRRTGRFLLEDHIPIVAPSFSVYVASLERARQQVYRGQVRLLAVGNPAFAPENFPSLKGLEAAGMEAQRVAAMYSDSLLLVGDQATRERLLHEIGSVDILHLATHAEEDRQMPGLSRIVLASKSGSSEKGILTADEISLLHLPRLELVILAGCRTARGQTSLSEGSQSLARAFLAAGAPAVIATLWKVDDSESAELIFELHRRMLGGENAASALRSAQLSFLRKGGPSRGYKATWAAFQLVGGVDSEN